MKERRFLTTRRAFLKRTAAAISLPIVVPSGLWGAGVGANDRISLGFIGMGKQSQGLLGGFMGRSDTEVAAVCDVDTTRREHARKTVETYYEAKKATGAYKECGQYTDFRRLLERKDIDAVVIATPDHWHALISIAAADAGKDIYCEKPMAHTVAEGRAMVTAVRRNRRVFQVGSMQRSSKEFRTACELVRNGALGKIKHVDVSVGGPGRPCDLPEEAMEAGLDWDLWLGPAPKRPYNSVLSPRGVHDHFPNWRNYREYGGGGVTDWGAHHFDIAQWGLGFDATGPIEIIPAEAPNASSGVKVRYETGVEFRHAAGNGVLFVGEKGRIQVNRGAFQLWIGEEQRAADVRACDQMIKELLPANAVRLYNSSNHLSDWVSSMRTRKMPICDVETGHRTSTVCTLVNLAYYHRQPLKWDPKSEKFVNGQGNAEWLLPKFRKPWKLS